MMMTASVTTIDDLEMLRSSPSCCQRSYEELSSGLIGCSSELPETKIRGQIIVGCWIAVQACCLTEVTYLVVKL